MPAPAPGHPAHAPPTALVYTPHFRDYDLGPSHPMRPSRVPRVYELIRACGLLQDPRVSVEEPSAADDETIALIHSHSYISEVRAQAEGGSLRRARQFGLGTVDTPVSGGLYPAAALIVGASVLAADLVADGKCDVAFNPGGGLHHAHRARAAGFCVFNDAAIAIAHLLRRCGQNLRVAYVDIDAHHGDGVQEAFYASRDVLTISLHETTEYLYPGRGGTPTDLGDGDGEGFSVNLPLSPFTTDEVYLRAFRDAAIPILEAFAPDFIVTQLGVDTHYQDPLTHMCLTTHGYLSVVDEIARRATRWVALGGGGYDLSVVPRAWTLAFARMAHLDPPEVIPESQAPRYRTAGQAALHDTSQPVIDEDWARLAREFAERSVAEVRERVFPFHGLR